MPWFLTPFGPHNVSEPGTIDEYERRDYVVMTQQQVTDYYAGVAFPDPPSFATEAEVPGIMATVAANPNSAFSVAQRAAFGAPATPVLTNAHGLARWRRALADALTVPAVVTCYGDSITQGNNADNSSGGTASARTALYRSKGWVGQLRSLFAAQYGSNGEGYVLLDNSGEEPRVTFTGAVLSSTVGPHQYGYSLTGTSQTIAIAVPAGTVEVDVITWWPSSGGQAWTYTWDAAAAPGTTAAVGTTGDRMFTTTIPTPDTGAHTLTIRGVAAGAVYISGIQLWTIAAANRTGIIVNRMGRPGVETATATNSGATGSNRDRVMRAAFQATGTHLAVVALGANDYWYQPGGHPGSGVDPTTYSANLQYLIDCVTGSNGKTVLGGYGTGCVLLIAGPRRPAWDLTGPTYAEESYYSAAKALATSNTHVAFLDIKDAWGANDAVVAAGLATAANVHPSRNGHGDYARMIHRALTSGEITAV